MREEPACPRCGYHGQTDARYCAHCGRALAPLRTRVSETANRFFDNLSPWYIVAFGVAALVSLGLLAQYYIVSTGLYFRVSFLLLALVVGSGCGFLGWRWGASRSSRKRFFHVLLVFAGMAALLALIRRLDLAILASFADSERVFVLDIPGVHLEASAGYKQSHRVSSPPPYWLITFGYGVLVGVVSFRIRKIVLRAGKARQ